MGNVLSVTGAIGGSCLSYIGPGAVYIGIHGAALIKMANDFWKLGPRRPRQLTGGDPERLPLQADTTTSATNGHDAIPTTTRTIYEEDAILIRFAKSILWYVFGMPVWYAMAKVGAEDFVPTAKN
jgi:sodium-coupled neutral amino acid transporter 11